jgi:hypothetical protein
VGLLVGEIVAVFLIIFVCVRQRCWWRGHAWRGWLPNYASPLVGLTKELERRERVTGIALDAQHFGNHLKSLPILAPYFQTHATSDIGKPLRQVNQSALRSNVLSCTFRQDVGAARLVPFRAHFE